MIYAWLGQIGGKLLALLAGALLCVLALWYVGHLRSQNATLGREKARLEASLVMLQENAALALKLSQKQRDDRIEREEELENEVRTILSAPLPKLPAVCDRALDPVRSAVGFVQRQSRSGGAADARPALR